MLLVPSRQLRSGMVLAQPVFHPSSSDLVLLNAGYTLDGEVIKRLQEFDLTHIWVRFPGLEELQTVPNERIGRGHMALYEALNSSIDGLEGRVVVKASVYRLKRAIGQMITEIVVHPDHEVITHQLMSCGPRRIALATPCRA